MSAPAFRHAPETQEPSGNARRRPRAYRRIAVRCGCWLEHEGATVFGTTVDIGGGGLFLRTALPMDPGADVRVTLRLPDQRGHVIAEGQIVHRVAPARGDARDRPGLGVRFIEVADGQALGAFLGAPLSPELTDLEDASESS